MSAMYRKKGCNSRIVLKSKIAVNCNKNIKSSGCKSNF